MKSEVCRVYPKSQRRVEEEEGVSSWELRIMNIPGTALLGPGSVTRVKIISSYFVISASIMSIGILPNILFLIPTFVISQSF